MKSRLLLLALLYAIMYLLLSSCSKQSPVKENNFNEKQSLGQSIIASKIGIKAIPYSLYGLENSNPIEVPQS
ncbi:MAG: hypothetical protein JW729_00410 [Bacteroidales bacterium]|nr:hypothetical protein [Bacteroidales bacterium]